MTDRVSVQSSSEDPSIEITNINFAQQSRYSSVVTVSANAAGGADDFEDELFQIVFFDPIHVDIRTHEDAFTSEYTDPKTGQHRWEHGSSVIEAVIGFERFERSSFLDRFYKQEPIHGPYENQKADDISTTPLQFRLCDGNQLISIVTYNEPTILRRSLAR